MTSLGELADPDLLEEVAARLNLRQPNKEALDSLVTELNQHFVIDGNDAPFECVIDSATGVGKTFILLGGIEYLAAKGLRHFVVIAPGTTIRDKTIAHFTEGDRRSLLPLMDSRPVLITADNFDTPSTRAAMDDDSRVKIYVFSVQSLTAPTEAQRRRTHVHREGLGAGFYAHLAAQEDLVVLADEHHCYFGPVFSSAIRELNPYAVIGLTATPAPSTPKESIIYRYPLAAAIAERWVKTPVIVARRDDRDDAMTKLADGVLLLGYKKTALDAYCIEHGLPPVNPVMLAVAQNITDAAEFARILRSEEFDGGRWADSILEIHSNLKGGKLEQALAELEAVEDPASKVRVIISVGMLKEGWDVKNVYVIASMRASVSTVLTEQTLGRGLRLPFGQYTGVELLDTVEVLAHDRYEALLRSAGALNEAFIDKRSRAVMRRNADGGIVAVVEEQPVAPPAFASASVASTDLTRARRVASPVEEATALGGIAIESFEERRDEMVAQSSAQDAGLKAYLPRVGMPEIRVPTVRRRNITNRFSLADIVDFEPFHRLGRKIAADPETNLRRTRVGARIITGADGLSHTELVTVAATDQLEASNALFPIVELRKKFVDTLLAMPVVPRRRDEAHPANRIVDALLEGVGPDAERILSAYAERAAARLLRAVDAEYRRAVSEPHFEDVTEITVLGKARQSPRTVILNRAGQFNKNAAYDSFARSLYESEWFESAPERTVANLVDDTSSVRCWVHLKVGEMPIVWREANGTREYNADMIVVDDDGTHWIVEIKADRDADSDEVQGKRRAAQLWVNRVSATEIVGAQWRYLLVTETDIDQARGSWSALKLLGV